MSYGEQFEQKLTVGLGGRDGTKFRTRGTQRFLVVRLEPDVYETKFRDLGSLCSDILHKPNPAFLPFPEWDSYPNDTPLGRESCDHADKEIIINMRSKRFAIGHFERAWMNCKYGAQFHTSNEASEEVVRRFLEAQQRDQELALLEDEDEEEAEERAGRGSVQDEEPEGGLIEAEAEDAPDPQTRARELFKKHQQKWVDAEARLRRGDRKMEG